MRKMRRLQSSVEVLQTIGGWLMADGCDGGGELFRDVVCGILILRTEYVTVTVCVEEVTCGHLFYLQAV